MRKVLHRIFFNFDDGPDPFARYLDTWKRELPDFEIMQWDKTNLPLGLNAYTRAMAAAKKHAFLSDYFRCWLLKEHGGAYLDADIEILDGDTFRRVYEGTQTADDHDLFIGVESVGNGLLTAHSMGVACGRGHPMLDFMMGLYEKSFSGPLARFVSAFTMPTLMSLFVSEQEAALCPGTSVEGRYRGLSDPVVERRMKIYPPSYFSPVTTRGGGKIVSSFGPETCLCHHFAATWKAAGAGQRTPALFAENLRAGTYQIERSVLPALSSRYGAGVRRARKRWSLTDSQIASIERFLNLLVPADTARYRAIRAILSRGVKQQ